MTDTESPWRFQVAASLSAATSSSSAWASAGGQARSCKGPATKITVLPATENWPLPALHQSSRMVSPASPISIFGIRFDPGCGPTSNVISNPNGNPLSPNAGMALSTAAPKTSAIAACLTNLVTKNIRPLERSRRAFLIGKRDIDQIGPAKKSPRGRGPAGILFVLAASVLLRDHRRERIDIGLQHHEDADKASQRDRMLEHEAQNSAFMPIPVGGGGGDHDRLRVDHLAHHAAGGVGGAHQHRPQAQL